jgi:hypothetical protein
MLNQSANGAAFLTATGEAPRVGEELELTGWHNAFAQPGEPNPNERSLLPQSARVVRLDEPQGMTQRVAVQYELAPAMDPT